MSVYVIASLTIKDAIRFEDYRRMLLPTMAKYGARLVARGGPIVLEGEWPRERLIIAEFPSMEQARREMVGDRPEYAEPKALRQATADSELVNCPRRVVEGERKRQSARGPIDHRVDLRK